MNKLVLDLQEIIDLIVATDKDYFCYGFHSVTTLLTEDGYQGDARGVLVHIPARLISTQMKNKENSETTEMVLDATLIFPSDATDFHFDLCIDVPESCQVVQSNMGTDNRLHTLEVYGSEYSGANMTLVFSPDTDMDSLNSFNYEEEEEEFDVDCVDLNQRKGKDLKYTVNTLNMKRENRYATILRTISIFVNEDTLPLTGINHDAMYKRIQRKLKNTKND